MKNQFNPPMFRRTIKLVVKEVNLRSSKRILTMKANLNYRKRKRDNKIVLSY